MCFNLYPAKEVQLFPDLGLYSGIFAIYLQLASKESRMTTVIFYALCLLYILSTATIVSDLLFYIIEVSNNSIYKDIFFLLVMQLHILPATRLQNDSQSQSLRVAMLFRLTIIRMVVFGFCDFIAQCTLVCINHCTYHLFYSLKSSKIYRCWIVWGKNIGVMMIVPSFLAIAFISQSIYLF